MKKFSPEVIGIGLTVIGVFASGGLAYGVIVTRQENQETRLAAVEQAPLDIAAIKASQARMESDIDALRADQRVILQAVTK